MKCECSVIFLLDSVVSLGSVELIDEPALSDESEGEFLLVDAWLRSNKLTRRIIADNILAYKVIANALQADLDYQSRIIHFILVSHVYRSISLMYKQYKYLQKYVILQLLEYLMNEQAGHVQV